jgi:elongation factor P
MKANDIRRGIVIMYNKTPHRVIDFRHHTPGNLRAMVQTKLRNLLNGTQTDVRFSSTEEVERADINTSPATYLYSDSEGFHFLNSDSYEQFAISREVLGEGVYYLQDEMQVVVTFYEGQPIGIELPSTVVLTVTETEPELRGATASNSPKPATTSTGLTVTVPPFVKIGDKIIVNTEEGKYIGRAE